MNNVKTFVSIPELEMEIRDLLCTKGAVVVAKMYGAPKGLSEEELIDFCVGVEYESFFK